MSNGQAEIPNVELVEDTGSKSAGEATKAAGRMLDELAGSHSNSQVNDHSVTETAKEAASQAAEKVIDSFGEGSSINEHIEMHKGDKAEQMKGAENSINIDDLGSFTGKIFE